jgi:hypothetical protein
MEPGLNGMTLLSSVANLCHVARSLWLVVCFLQLEQIQHLTILVLTIRFVVP